MDIYADDVIRTLTEFNEWRRDGEGEQPDPKVVGEAIDKAVYLLKYCGIASVIGEYND